MKNFDLFFQKLVDIKESWEIFRLFEEERQRFLQEKEEYRLEIEKNQENLRQCRNLIQETKVQIENLQKQKEQYQKAIDKLQEKKTTQRIKNNISKLHEEKQHIKEKNEEILPHALQQVEVFMEDGEIRKMRCARKIYDESLFGKYRVALKESRIFRNKIAELELENSQLKIELRDLHTEMILEERLKK